jgi:predicted nucleic acid-binding protein
MARLIYLLDTNVIADRLKDIQPLSDRMSQAFKTGYILILCQPVYYEIIRGLEKAGSIRKMRSLYEDVLPQLTSEALTDEDWRQAATYWVDAQRKGRALSDIDLLVAAMTTRLEATLVSSDQDFDVLPVKREDWRRV